MNWSEVLERIHRGEDERTEFKRAFDDRGRVGRAVAAFANTEGGLIVLGVDNSGTVSGTRDDPDVLAERPTNFLQNGLSAPVQARLGRHRTPKGWVHWIEVPRQRGFEPIRSGGQVYVRRGRANVEPAPAELQDLYNLFGYVVTEERAIEAAGVEDIDLQAFRKYLARLGLDTEGEPQPSTENDLRNRGVIVEVGGRPGATVYGVLAFGKDPQAYPQTRNFWVECVAYGGTERADEVLQVAEGKGRIDEQVRRVVGWLKGLARRERYLGIERRDQPLVPEKAAREVIVNAVVHRDYAITGSKVLLEVFSDRVVVTSPGTLPNTITPASVKAGGHPRSRNELLANYMMTMGMMKQRGRGWPIIRRAMLEHSGLEPDLSEDRESRFVRVTLPISVSGQLEVVDPPIRGA